MGTYMFPDKVVAFECLKCGNNTAFPSFDGATTAPKAWFCAPVATYSVPDLSQRVSLDYVCVCTTFFDTMMLRLSDT